MKINPKLTYTAAEAAPLLGMTPARVGQLCAKGILSATRGITVGRERWQIVGATLVAFRKIKRRPGRPKA